MSVSNKNSGIHAGGHEKYAMNEKNGCFLKFFYGRKDFIWLIQKSSRIDFGSTILHTLKVLFV